MKVTLYLQDEIWKKFKRGVLRKTGELRRLSSEVQELIEDSSEEDSLRKGFERLGMEIKPISSSQVVAIKPSVPTSSSATIRKMRDARHYGSNKNLPG